MNGMVPSSLSPWLVLVAFAAAIILTYVLILWLRPLMRRYALARPNARSSHREPTPQGGGIAVVGVTLALTAIVVLAMRHPSSDISRQLALVIAAALVLAITGAIDDVRAMAAAPRLIMHVAAAAIMLAALPSELRLIPALPLAVERAVLLIAVVWFINLVNFMDGIDWMTVAEVVPICAGLLIVGALGALPPVGIIAATALGGAMIGFAPFNRPVASLFLGDVGSVPIGLLLTWLLLQLAGTGHIAAALLLPLYYLADATLTLGRRLIRGERFWEAHRSHFYQQATDRGFSVSAIVAQVVALNVALVVLAVVTVVIRAAWLDVVALIIGALLVTALLHRFWRGPAKRPGAARTG